jgi:cytochrome c553
MRPKRQRHLAAAVAAFTVLVSAPFTAGTAFGQQPAAAGDPAEAHKKIAMCEGCHGIPGYKTAYPQVYHVPKLGGQSAAYLANALAAYKAGQRSHPSMRAIATSLTDKDIADLAAYYAGAKK